MRSAGWLLLLTACGARTDLGGTKTTEAGMPCTKAPWVLFDTVGGIGAIRSDGTGFHLAMKDAFMPSVSPDGTSLLYITVANDDADETLTLMDLPSGHTRTIAHETIEPPHAGFGKAAVSYDGKWIAFGNSPDLHLAAFDGSGDHVIVTGPYEAGCCPWSYGHPQFSADSSLIYFSTIGRLSSIRVDGSGNTLLYQDHFWDGLFPGFVFPNVSLSNDGKKLVAEVACDVTELRVFDVASLPASDPCTVGTKIVETGLSQASNESSNPSWGPTDLVAYDDDKDVWLIPAGGGAKTNLTAALTTGDNAFAADPVWAGGCANIP